MNATISTTQTYDDFFCKRTWVWCLLCNNGLQLYSILDVAAIILILNNVQESSTVTTERNVLLNVMCN